MKRLTLILLLAMSFLFLITQESIPVTAASSNSQEKPMHFYFHWLENPVYVGGRDQHFIMNTTQFFQPYNNSIYKDVGSPKLVVDFYLYPHLAGPVTFNGTWRVFVWVNASALKPTEWSLQFFEVTSGGNVTWDSGVISPIVTGGPAGYPGYLSPQILCYNLSTPSPVAHTFSKDSTVVVEITINPGADVSCELWYDSSSFPSKAIFPSLNYARPSTIKTYDVNGTERNIFEMYWSESQRKVVIRANVTDPFGGYDIYKVNVTVSDPVGNKVLDDVNMTRVMDILWAFNYSNVYEANWTYPETALSGNYTIKVSVIDNNGYYYYLTYNVYDPYIEHGYHSFSIGISYQINFLAVDTLARPLAGAVINVIHFDVLTAQGITDINGSFSVKLAAGLYNITVYWQGTIVNSTVNYEVVAPANVTLFCLVYDVEVEVVDSLSDPLENAEVFILFPNGTTTILPIHTDANGKIPLPLIPYGIYDFTVYWQNTLVNKTQTTLDFNGILTIRCRVYTVTLSLLDSLDKPLANALIVFNAPNGTSNLAIFTDLYGKVTLTRISNGTYEFTIIWQLTPIYTVSPYIDSNTPITIRCPVYYLTVKAVDSIGEALSGAEIIAQFPAGTKTVYIANSTGHVKLSQIIAGYYNFTVLWGGTPVNSTSPLLVSSSGLPVYTIECSVYYLTVRTVDSLGQALSNAEVFVQSPVGTETVYLTNNTGYVRLSQIPGGNYNFRVLWYGVPVNSTATIFVESNLQDYKIITEVYYPVFNIVDWNGDPLIEASVTIKGAITRVGVTNQSGNIYFSQVPVGNFEVIVKWQNIRVSSHEPVMINRNNPTYMVVTFVYYLTVKAVDSIGEALSNAEVIVQLPSGVETIHLTNSTGYIDLYQIPRGYYNFTVLWFGVPVNSTSLFIDTNLAGYNITTKVYHPTFHIVDTKGKPLSKASITLSGTITRVGTTNQNGIIKFSQIPTGNFELIVTWHDIQVSPTDPILIDRNTPVYDVVTNVYYLTVRVVDSMRAPLSGAEVSIQFPNMIETVYATNSTGYFELNQIPIGYYDFSVSWFDVTVNSTSSFLIDRNLPVFVISTSVYNLKVEIVDAGNNTLEGAQVILIGSKLTRTTITDKNGVAEFKQIPIGDYNLKASYVGQYAFMSWSKSGSKTINVDRTQTVKITLAYPPATTELLSSSFPWMLLGAFIGIAILLLTPKIYKKLKAKGLLARKQK
jgi:hypothetical protein